MPVKLKLLNSVVKSRQPDPASLEYGELCINQHAESAAIYFKDNAGGLQKIGVGSNVPNGGSPPNTGNTVGDLYWDSTTGFLMVWNGSTWVVAGVENLDDLADVDTDGAVDGMVLAYDSGEWKPLSPAQLTVDVDLEYSKQTDKGIILNSAGDDATIIAADTIYAGLMLPADKIKLNGIEAGAEENVGTNLTWVPDSTNGIIESSTGTDATIPLGNGINAGLSLNDFSDEAKDKLDGIADGAIAEVNLGYTAAADKGTVTNDAGDDATLPLATGTNAGLSLNNFSAADKSKLDGIEPGAGAGTVTSVDSGNGLTGGPITDAGTLAVQADGSTITVGADGIKVTDGEFVTPGDLTTELGDYLPLEGGNLTGGVTQTVRAISPSRWDLEEGNLWEVGGIDVPNPSNIVVGMTGAIVLMAAPTSWGAFCKFAGGTALAPSAFPAVAPYYVRGNNEILIGTAVEGIN
mgnify:CR=1 FL=1